MTGGTGPSGRFSTRVGDTSRYLRALERPRPGRMIASRRGIVIGDEYGRDRLMLRGPLLNRFKGGVPDYECEPENPPRDHSAALQERASGL